MDTIKKYKYELAEALKKLPELRQKEVLEFYNKIHLDSVFFEIIAEARQSAQRTMDLADRRGYGYGECYYYLSEYVKEFEEDFPELKKEYKHLIYAYYDFLTEAKNI